MTQNNGASWLFETDTVEYWAYKNAVFSHEECAKIIALGESLIPEAATTVGNNAASIRESKVSWLLQNADTSWIFDRLAFNILSLMCLAWTSFPRHIKQKTLSLSILGFL
jgi:hypothetical protein